MVYNFNLGIGWASSGVEYAQAYRGGIFRKNDIDARFVYMDMFVRENIEHMTANMGFEDQEIIWLYSFFTDYKIAPVTYTLEDVEKTIEHVSYTKEDRGDIVIYRFLEENTYYRAYLVRAGEELVHRVEMVSNDKLIRKDFFTYGRVFTEYYAPLDGKAHLYQRRFFNTDGSVAYDEMIDNDIVTYQFPDRLIYSKEELVAYLVKRLQLTEDDLVIIDRTTGIGQAIIENAAPARVAVVIHADHFSEGATDENNILWNNYYEYSFSQHKHVDYYIVATDAQNNLLREQFAKYMSAKPNVVTIPVGSLDELLKPDSNRRKHSIITASRLADEKHVDWIISAVLEARKTVLDISLDIYGEGGAKDALSKQIEEANASDFIRLMGQHDLSKVYIDYEAYVSGSQSEGFGLTLLESLGSGLPIIGFDVRYGNQTFIRDGENGYLIPVHDKMDEKEKIKELTDRIVKLFTQADITAFSDKSYELAEQYLTSEVEKRWINLVKG